MLFVGLSLGADEGKKLPDGDSLGGPDGASESAKLGLLEGFNDNPSVGTSLRAALGLLDGETLGKLDGLFEGDPLRSKLGKLDDDAEGCTLGEKLGPLLGLLLGSKLGPSLEAALGLLDGEKLGEFDDWLFYYLSLFEYIAIMKIILYLYF